MIPNIQPSDLYSRSGLPSRTYFLDFDKGRVVGKIDGLDAIRQFIYKSLQTNRWEHVIYTAAFGSEHGSVGRSNTMLQQSEIIRTITEALIYDERISRVHSFQFLQTGDMLLVSFWVDTAEGNVQIEVKT